MLIIEEIKIELLKQSFRDSSISPNNLTSKYSIIIVFYYHPGEAKFERHGEAAMCSNPSLQSKAFVEDQQSRKLTSLKIHDYSMVKDSLYSQGQIR